MDDDSPDGTARQVLELSRTNPRVRLVHRINRRGLSSAVVEGMMASNAPYLAVMDGDMQHDETVLPEMLRRLRTGDVDLVVGTRHREGGSMGESLMGSRGFEPFGTALERAGLPRRCLRPHERLLRFAPRLPR